jgi:uncharacterized membrane protein YhhN
VILYAGAMVVLVGLVLVASYRKLAWLEWIAKPAASATFIAAAVAMGAMRSTYGHVLLIGLVLAAAGDVLLIPKSRKSFLFGLVAFLLGHLAYAIAFAIRGVEIGALGMAAAVLIVIAVPILRWLWPHVPPHMRVPVACYITVITAMVALSFAAAAHISDLRMPAGALAFYLSDLAVARNRFVKEGFVNRAWGLPLYFGSQLVLAWTID